MYMYGGSVGQYLEGTLWYMYMYGGSVEQYLEGTLRYMYMYMMVVVWSSIWRVL